MSIFYWLRNSSLAGGLGLILFCIIFSSCGNTRQLVYMQGKFDTAQLSRVPVLEQVIRKGDLLSIIVYSDNPEATRIYNQTLITAGPASSGLANASTSATSLSSSPSSPGYLVDDNGNIEFQGLGLLHVDSLSRSQLKDTITARLQEFLVHPYCTVRFLNYRFTMLGEVARPGIFSIPGEHVNLFEALGMAGDMTFFGRRDNILVVRENNGQRTFGRMDITKPEIMGSPFFYLQPNDIVIIEPTTKKIAANDQTALRNISIAATIISTLAILYSVFK